MSSVWYVTSLYFGSRILYTHMSFTIRNNHHPQLPILALCQLSFKFKAFALSRAIIRVPRTCPKEWIHVHKSTLMAFRSSWFRPPFFRHINHHGHIFSQVNAITLPISPSRYMCVFLFYQPCRHMSLSFSLFPILCPIALITGWYAAIHTWMGFVIPELWPTRLDNKLLPRRLDRSDRVRVST